jgi:YfiH family protein
MKDFFGNIRGVKAFLSERQDGNMKLFSFGFEERRKKFLIEKSFKYNQLVSAKLEHRNNVSMVKNAGDRFIDYCDGLITNNPEIILSVTVADCFPVFLFDSKQKVIGILHCGWRSVAKNIIENCVDKMRTDFNSKSKNLLISIGPGIQKCHFQVGKEFIVNFHEYDEFFNFENEKIFFDLNGVIVKKLIFKGIHLKNIENDESCTFCNERLWSYRRDGVDKNGDVQAMIAGIKLKN